MKRKLQRKRKPRKSLLKNLANSLILYQRITTTLEKAKELRSLAERLIEKGKKGDLAARRELLKFLPKNTAAKIIEELAPAFSNQKGGYLNIIKLGQRSGDGANMALVELKLKKELKDGKQPETESKKESTKT